MFKVTGGSWKGSAGPARSGLKKGPALGVWGGAKDGGLPPRHTVPGVWGFLQFGHVNC